MFGISTVARSVFAIVTARPCAETTLTVVLILSAIMSPPESKDNFRRKSTFSSTAPGRSSRESSLNAIIAGV